MALAAESNENLQDLIHKVDAESRRFGLKISAAKTECIATQEHTLAIDINEERLHQTKDFLRLHQTKECYLDYH